MPEDMNNMSEGGMENEGMGTTPTPESKPNMEEGSTEGASTDTPSGTE